MTTESGEQVLIREEAANYCTYDINFHGILYVADGGYKTRTEAATAAKRELSGLRRHLSKLRLNRPPSQ